MTNRTVSVQTEPFECVPHWLLFDQRLTANGLRVYLILRKFRDYETSLCHPSRKKLASMAKVSPSTLDRSLAELVDIGAIRVTHRYGKDSYGQPTGQTSNLYEVFWDDPATHKQPTPITTDEEPPSPPVTSPPIQMGHTNKDPIDQDPLNKDPSELIGFDHFWTAYPRKKGKGQARTAWAKAAKKVDPAVIVAAAVQFRQWCEQDGTEPQFIAHPSTWLNGERWTDERDPQPQTRVQGWLSLLNETVDNSPQSYPQLEG